MPWILRIWGLPGKVEVSDVSRSDLERLIERGYFLRSFDVDAHDGRGDVTWTADIVQAMRFDSFRAAMEAWRTQSTVQPLRPDGKPNRPLTAFSVQPMEVAK